MKLGRSQLVDFRGSWREIVGSIKDKEYVKCEIFKE